MRKITVEAGKQCPYCGAIDNQIRQGRTSAGSQRCLCKDCARKYTLDPKPNAYPEEVRQNAIKIYLSGVSGTGVGNILGMNKSNVVRWIKKSRRTKE